MYVYYIYTPNTNDCEERRGLLAPVELPVGGVGAFNTCMHVCMYVYTYIYIYIYIEREI